MVERYLGVKQVAERLGITAGGLLNLRLPEPDAYIGRTRGWKAGFPNSPSIRKPSPPRLSPHMVMSKAS